MATVTVSLVRKAVAPPKAPGRSGDGLSSGLLEHRLGNVSSGDIEAKGVLRQGRDARMSPPETLRLVAALAVLPGAHKGGRIESLAATSASRIRPKDRQEGVPRARPRARGGLSPAA